MKKFNLPIKVMFSDCDPAQIVFYPKYFQWFDVATQKMFNDLGMEWSTFWPDRGLAGLPLVDASATFKGPARMDDEINIESWVDDWKEKIFVVRHNVVKDGIREMERGEGQETFGDFGIPKPALPQGPILDQGS